MPFSPRLSRRDFVKGMLATPLAAAYSSYASALPKDRFIQVPEESGFGMRIEPEAWNHPASIHAVTEY